MYFMLCILSDIEVDCFKNEKKKKNELRHFKGDMNVKVWTILT